jgi:hypothetical protein
MSHKKDALLGVYIQSFHVIVLAKEGTPFGGSIFTFFLPNLASILKNVGCFM